MQTEQAVRMKFEGTLRSDVLYNLSNLIAKELIASRKVNISHMELPTDYNNCFESITEFIASINISPILHTTIGQPFI